MSWKTTLLGIVTIVGAVAKIIAALSQGGAVQTEDVVLVATGAGLVAAKDHNK